MRLIDADELIEHAYRDRLDSRELIANMINNAPTVQEIPVNVPLSLAIKALEQEPKEGHWIFQKIKYGEHLAPMRLRCSNCNSAFDLCCNQIKQYDEVTRKDNLWAYCPWCGAKMEDRYDR